MGWIVTKYLITAGMVVLVSELAKRYPRAGGLVAALPLVTVLTLIWLHVERQPQSRLADHARYTFWYVLPTLPMFLIFPALLPRLGFWPTLGACAAVTAAAFWALAVAGRAWGLELL